MSTAYYRNFKMQSLVYFLLTDIAHLCATSAFGTEWTASLSRKSTVMEDLSCFPMEQVLNDGIT